MKKMSAPIKSTLRKRCFNDFGKVDKVQLINANKIKNPDINKHKI